MTHRIRCKMICHSVTPHNPVSADNPMSSVRFGAVYSPDTGNPDDENAVFGKYTPYAAFDASWSTPVAEKLEVGKAYYVDFTLADDQAAAKTERQSFADVAEQRPRIVMELLADGDVALSGYRDGRMDSAYPPMPIEKALGEVTALAQEIR